MFRVTPFLIVASLFLGACETTEGYRQHMTAWQGSHTDDLVIEWGPPDEISTLSDGREVWIYERVEFFEGGGYYDHEYHTREQTWRDKEGELHTRSVTESYPVYVPPYTRRSQCNTHFVVSKDDIVRAVTFYGEGCVARELR